MVLKNTEKAGPSFPSRETARLISHDSSFRRKRLYTIIGACTAPIHAHRITIALNSFRTLKMQCRPRRSLRRGPALVVQAWLREGVAPDSNGIDDESALVAAEPRAVRNSYHFFVTEADVSQHQASSRCLPLSSHIHSRIECHTVADVLLDMLCLKANARLIAKWMARANVGRRHH